MGAWPRRAASAQRRRGGDRASSPSMEELIDLEQQAEFFVVLGQDEAAMALLESYIENNGKSPLPYLQLLEIHQRRGDRASYEALRQHLQRALRRRGARLERQPAARPRPRGLSADGGTRAIALVDAAFGDADARRPALSPRAGRGNLRPAGLSRAAGPLLDCPRGLRERRDRFRLDRPVPAARGRAARQLAQRRQVRGRPRRLGLARRHAAR